MECGDQSIMHTTRSGSGAPELESSAQALARVDAFITDHQDRGDLVFQKRVDRDLCAGTIGAVNASAIRREDIDL